ncbi:MAG: histidinol-phosphate transaminase, partial [Rhodobiaceae bacterium]|nr:histidinol-phosphate transaminase [Rhodobiaceae bacterium]
MPRSGVLDIAAYVPGTHAVAGHARVYRLSSNETPLGASPAAKAAIARATEHPELYPDGSAGELRRAIAAQYGLNADRIICGAGSDELLNLLAHGFLEPGDEAIYTE